MPEFLGPFFQEVHFLILFQYLEEEGFEEEVVLTPDVAVVKVAKEKIMNEKTSTCFLQESLYYNLMVYVGGVIFTVSIVAYAVYQTYQVAPAKHLRCECASIYAIDVQHSVNCNVPCNCVLKHRLFLGLSPKLSRSCAEGTREPKATLEPRVSR